jgi:hypothetical protein
MEQLRAEVYCSWHGVIPIKSYPRILLPPDGFELIYNYSGKVLDNISP